MARISKQKYQSMLRQQLMIFVALVLCVAITGCALAKRVACATCKGSGKCQVCGGNGKALIPIFSTTCGLCNGNGKCRECEGWGY